MRILVDLGSHVAGTPVVTQVEKTPDGALGDTLTPLNGKYLLPVPLGEFALDSGTDYVLPIDGGDLSSKAYALLLSTFPMYGHIYFNPLLTGANVSELDLTAQFLVVPTPPAVPYTLPTRFQTGSQGVATMPMMTAVLPLNPKVTAPNPERPGILITTEIDISVQTGGVGADDFMVYWKLYEFTTQDDIVDDTINQPAVKLVQEIEPDQTDFSVYLSPDNGVHWCEVDYLTAIAFGAKTTKFRLAFRNDSAAKRFLVSFAVLF